MKNILIAFIIVLTTIAFNGCGTTRSLTVKESIDTIMTEYNAGDGPGASVLVMVHDSIVFKKAYGSGSLKNNDHVSTITNFRLASMTKQFTAMCIMMLEDQGKLSFDDKIMKFFPDFPLYGKDITVRNLLNHTSGLVDYESLIPDSQTVQVLDADCLRLMTKVDTLYFTPGTKYQYSNTGFAILSLIVEKVSGKRFADFLKENIFSKTGMKSTVAYENGISVVEHRAYGYSRVDGQWNETDQSNTSAVLGDGGIYSNVEDLAEWISALWKYNLIPEKTQRAAWDDALLNDGTPISYGMGWHTEIYRGVHHPHHGGSTRGFRNHILIFPNDKAAVIILTNRNEGDPIIEAKKIADLMLIVH